MVQNKSHLKKLLATMIIVLIFCARNYTPVVADSFYPSGYVEDSQLNISFVYGVIGSELTLYSQGESIDGEGSVGLYAKFNNESGHDIWANDMWLFAGDYSFVTLGTPLYRELYYINSSTAVHSLNGKSSHYDKRFSVPQGISVQKLGELGTLARVSVVDLVAVYDTVLHKYRVELTLINPSDYPVRGAFGSAEIGIGARETVKNQQLFDSIAEIPRTIEVAASSPSCILPKVDNVRLAVSRDDLGSSFWGGLIINDDKSGGYYCASLASYSIPVGFELSDHQTDTANAVVPKIVNVLDEASSLLRLESLQEFPRSKVEASGAVEPRHTFWSSSAVLYSMDMQIKSIRDELILLLSVITEGVRSVTKSLLKLLIAYALFLVAIIMFAISFQPKRSSLPRKRL